MFSLFRNANQLENVERQLVEMLDVCSRMYGVSCRPLFGDASPDEVKEEVYAMDKLLNRTEREIRRELLVHGTVHGGEVDQGLLLAYMSVAKDIERVGDYCKNIWGLADVGVALTDGEDVTEIKTHVAHVAELIDQTKNAFATQDEAEVHRLIPTIQTDARHYEDHVTRFIGSDRPGTEAVPRALLYRYLKRISAHLANVLTSVVMPVDRLDFYKRSKSE
jgi:phosphate transport system protein